MKLTPKKKAERAVLRLALIWRRTWGYKDYGKHLEANGKLRQAIDAWKKAK